MNPYIDAILEVAPHCKDVKINEQKLEECAKVWAQEDLLIPDWRMPIFPEADDDDFVQFLGIGNSLNYCFTDVVTKQKYETEYLGKQWRGAFGMWAALKRALDRRIQIDNPVYLSDFMADGVVWNIFRGNPPLPMLPERLLCLRTAGAMLEAFDSYAEFFKSHKYRAFDCSFGIVERLVRYDPCYSDVTYHEPTQTFLRFHKRANLFVMMYHGRALASNGALPLIEDADDLTPPADYEVPKSLRHLGILEYSTELAHDVDAQIEIPAHSRWEQEIRVQTVAVMTQLCKLSGKPIAAVDYKCFMDGKASPKPHHLTATTAY